MDVAIIADSFPPLRTSAAVQLRDLAGEFLKQGHRPTMIVPAPELRTKWELENYHGIRVLRANTLKMKDVNYVRRTLAEVLMPFMILLRLFQSGLLGESWDGVIWYSPSIFFGPLVLFLKKKHGCRSYLILRDIFPEWAVDMGLMRRGIPYRFFKVVEKLQYWSADAIGVQSEAARPYLREILKREPPHIDLLQNWLTDNTSTDCSISIDATPLAGRKICVYTGNMGVAQDVDVFLDLASDMQDRDYIGFLFVGRGSEAARLRQKANTEALSNVLFLDEIDPDEISGLISQCHIGLLSLDLRHTTHNTPGKFLTYMRGSQPVLASVNSGNELSVLIKKNRVGSVSETRNLNELRGGLLNLLDSESEHSETAIRCRTIYEALFSPTKAVETILSRLQADEGHRQTHRK